MRGYLALGQLLQRKLCRDLGDLFAEERRKSDVAQELGQQKTQRDSMNLEE